MAANFLQRQNDSRALFGLIMLSWFEQKQSLPWRPPRGAAGQGQDRNIGVWLRP
jgi:hypothetical protein